MIPQDFPITERPYEEMAANAGVSEEEFLERLEKLKKESVIRRVAAILYHRKVLYTHNAMVVWKVDENETERIGWVMASFPEVSHCYERDNGGFWEYTLYTMIHGKNMDNCMDTVRRISEKTGIKEFEIFLSKREFKKTSLSVEEDVRLDYSV
jgi:DNA-binding Lrp family transcriptional regulator